MIKEQQKYDCCDIVNETRTYAVYIYLKKHPTGVFGHRQAAHTNTAIKDIHSTQL